MADRMSFDRSSSEIATSPGAAPTASGGPHSSAAQHVRLGADTQDVAKEPDQVSLAYGNVVQSDIGVNTLLSRLKQSVASARDFAVFLKKRSTIEEDHAQSLKKLTRSALESTRRPDSRQGSYARSYEEITRIHDRLADNGIQFALSLHQMHEDLNELSLDKERGRKLWKQNGLSAEKRVQDAEAAMEKAKTKYNSLAEDYDRARTGDKQSGRFGLKGPKSAAQVEEDLHRKMQAADADYSSKVQAAQSLRQELISSLRPQAVKALEMLIHECDSALTLQMQKFATFNERLLLGNGICVNPIEDGAISTQPSRSLRDIVSQIDNEQDLRQFVTSFSSKVGSKQHDLEYKRHPTLQSAAAQQGHVQPTAASNRLPSQSISGTGAQHLSSAPTSIQNAQPPTSYQQAPPQFPAAPPANSVLDSTDLAMVTRQETGASTSPPDTKSALGAPHHPQSGHGTGQNHASYGRSPEVGLSISAPTGSYLPNGTQHASVKPIFGLSLDALFQRDGSAVPMVVYQCIQAVDLYGLDVEGIYRLSGTASHINQLRTMFDHDSIQVDFRNPESFMHDVNSVAGLLKQFFRDLPDPLLTHEHYQSFIDAARIDDDITRRDSLHATINSLPDPNYATLRALTLHLHRVQEHSNANRMTSANLAICFGPTLMVSGSPPAIADAGWQVRVIDTILQNTYQIFDDD